ncbi:MAG: phospholipase D-like domain-containing protein [Thiolinea sp.]
MTPVLKKKSRMLLLCLLLVALLLLGLRLAGEYKFTPKPEQSALLTVSEGQLKSSIDTALAEGKGNNLYIPLSDARLALLSRMLLARYASQTIDLQYYLFHDDESGRALLGELIAAAQRGVKVRLLLDDMDTVGRDGLFIRLVQDIPNLQVRVFNPALLRSVRIPEYLARFPRVTRRMHNKSITADGIATIVGGRNVGNEYFHLQSKVAFADFDVLAGGPIALAVNQVFEQYWSSGLAFDMHTLNAPASDQAYQSWRTQVDTDTAAFQRNIAQEAGSLAVQKLVEGSVQPYYDGGRVLSDPPAKVISSLFDQSNNMVSELIPLLDSTQHELLIPHLTSFRARQAWPCSSGCVNGVCK